MHIYPKQTGPVRPDAFRTPQVADQADIDALRSVPATGAGSDRSDTVSISDAGRALAARDGATDVSSQDPARLDRVRDRVLSGAYDTLEVIDAVARRLLDRGDV